MTRYRVMFRLMQEVSAGDPRSAIQVAIQRSRVTADDVYEVHELVEQPPITKTVDVLEYTGRLAGEAPTDAH